ncbi:MAG TPA: hypothetical protein VLE72_00080 [Candidatus Saccharimonadales bacterium]|nr:hypothetical protein [Candidatus Saccharimonadales bacterium]
MPIKSNDRLVKSTVSWQNNGQQFSRSFNLEWWKHVGTSMSVWTKGSAGALSDPTGPRSAIFAGIVLGFVAGAVIFFILLGLSAISGALVESYAAKEAKARAEGDADRAAPATREEFIELCRTHSKITVTPDDVIALGACSTGVYTFRDIHFPGRDTVTLGELVRFMDRNNVYWSWVMKVANSKLRDVGVVRSDYFYSGFVRTPTDWLEDEVTASADS